ncbi:hypothetical protein VSS74_28160, partial [Conexibacter stalactiti]|nr:hypothetical protein [Conexibacter stalactiti]MEC5038907.1 hypothetical protein [Conexibacter stalactiti]
MGVLLLLVVVLALAAPVARGDVLLDESFSGPTASIPLRVGGSFVPCLTASTDTAQANVAGCAPGQPSIPAGGDADGQGALRLTDNGRDRSGFAIYRRAFPLTEGLRFTFTTFAYNGTRVPGYGAADGISVFLADGAIAASTPGAFGGSLGYAQKSLDFEASVPDIAGVPGGYVGVGIDEFGNFANDREARGYGCSSRVDRDIHPNYVSLRGAGVAGSDWLRGYCLLDREPAPGVLDAPDAVSRAAPGVAHTFRLEVDPAGNPDGTPNLAARVRLLADMASTGAFVPVLDAPLPPDPPTTFEFGMAASTGMGTNIHELRALRLETLRDLPRWTLAKSHPEPLVAGTRGRFTLRAALAADGGAAYAPVTLDDDLPPGLTVAEPPHGDGWECGATVLGSATTRCTYAASLTDPLTPGTRLPPVTVPVAVAADAVGERVNVARLSGDELLEPVIARDPFELGRSLDLRIDKRAQPARIAAGDTTSFTLVVVNDGPSDAPRVLVTDRVPEGLRYADALPSQGSCRRTAALLRCRLGGLRAGASAHIVIDAVATAAASGRTLRNVAVVRAAGDRDPRNDEDDAAVEVVGPDDPSPPPAPIPPPPPLPPTPMPTGGEVAQLVVEKRAAVARAQVGQPVDYEIRVRNTGSATARDVVLTDTTTLAGDVRAAAAATTLAGSVRPIASLRRACTRSSGTVVRCRLGDLAPGATTTIRAQVVYERAGRALDTASVAPAYGSLEARSDTAGVIAAGGAALAIEKHASRTRLHVGDAVRFRIAVRSLGPEPARRLRVCDRLPRALRLLAAPGARRAPAARAARPA